tara:strand:- start:3749 stop:4147 length:399 start_codon:yes stop_codon:yes gene_type:complete
MQTLVIPPTAGVIAALAVQAGSGSIVLSVFAGVSLLFRLSVVLSRILMNRRVWKIESGMGDCERKVVPIVFTRLWSWQKESEIEEVKKKLAAGWQYLKRARASDSSLLRTKFGGIDVHFIRAIPNSETVTAS